MAKKVAAPKAAQPEVLDVAPVVDSELAVVLRDGGVIASFVHSLRPFFQRATELERDADQALTVARSWQLPRSQVADEAIVRAVRENSIALKEIEVHWEICARVHAFHRWLTARREKAVSVRRQVIDIGNRLHTVYLRDEEERVRQENARLQREAEEKARQEREAVLAELEQVALAKEAASADLSERERVFLSHYVLTGNARVAAQRAGYKDVDAQAQRLLKSPKIQAAITAKEEAQAARQQAAAKREEPLYTDPVPEAKPEVAKGDRTTLSAELFDEAAFIDAVLNGTSPVPKEDLRVLLTVRPVALNGYARSMGEKINRWPGCRLKTTTRIV